MLMVRRGLSSFHMRSNRAPQAVLGISFFLGPCRISVQSEVVVELFPCGHRIRLWQQICS